MFRISPWAGYNCSVTTFHSFGLDRGQLVQKGPKYDYPISVKDAQAKLVAELKANKSHKLTIAVLNSAQYVIFEPVLTKAGFKLSTKGIGVHHNPIYIYVRVLEAVPVKKKPLAKRAFAAKA